MIKALGQRDILLQFSQLFSLHSIPYLLTGSFAVSYYGFPRATHDIDFVIETEAKDVSTMIAAIKTLNKDFLVASDINAEYLKNSTQFNLFHIPTGVKIDFWVVNRNEFTEKYDRRKTINIDENQISIVSSEDLIITKLKWCKEIFSERHMRDCVGMWQIQKDKLDRKYLTRKIKEYRLEKLFQQMISLLNY